MCLVYKLMHEGKVVFLVLYVDDILLIGNDVGVGIDLGLRKDLTLQASGGI